MTSRFAPALVGLLIALALPIAACGSSDEEKPAATQAQTTTAAPATTSEPAAAAEAEEPDDGLSEYTDPDKEALTVVALSRNLEQISGYCEAKDAGALTQTQRRGLELVTFNVRTMANENPGLDVGGQSLPAFIATVADSVRACNPAAAAKLDKSEQAATEALAAG